MADDALQVLLTLLHADELAKKISSQLQTPTSPPPSGSQSSQTAQPMPNLNSFPNPVQDSLVPGGQQNYIGWQLLVPKGYVAIARTMSLDPYYMLDVVDWQVDGKSVYDSGIRWTIGEINSPVKVLKKAYSTIYFYIDNNDPSKQSHNYEIQLDGIIVPLADESLADQLILNGAL